MSLLIKNWSTADWKELLKWAKIGANNAMIGEFTEVEELPPHGRLIDADALSEKMVEYSKHIPKNSFGWDLCGEVITQLALAPAIIEAEGE